MRASMAYFAGAGTVVVAIAVGLGGGLVIANVMNPHTMREMSKVELQAKTQQSPQPGAAEPSSQPSPAAASNAPQTPAPYLAQVKPAANAPVVVGTSPQNQPQPQSRKQNDTADAARPAAPAAKTIDLPAKRDDAALAKPDDAAKAKQAEETPSQPAQASSPENAYGKARDADLKRDDKRKDRHQRWAQRRQQQRDQEMRDVEEQVRRDTGPREYIVRRDDVEQPDSDRPARFDFPHVNLFGPD